MKVEFIYSYDDRPQEIVMLPIADSILKDQEDFRQYALYDLSIGEVSHLVKISSFIYFGSMEIPAWYKECDGKLWFKKDEI